MTEAEWEKAAKGGCEAHGDPGTCDASDTPAYPWGGWIAGPRANYSFSGDPYDNNTTPVGYYDGSNHGGYQTIDSPSPYGLYDVAGNVWEWCSTKYEAYPYNPNDGREYPPATYDERPGRVLRGGCYGHNATDGDMLKCASRTDDSEGPSLRDNYTGFRCARSE
jgi:formylglycine-generating enzyme required for sulfatase activity